MIFRTAFIKDIPGIQLVRNAVRENVLSDPGLVTDEDCAHYLTQRGKGWVCEIDCRIAGFAIADLEGHNIWALFLDPGFEGLGIAKTLHRMMMDWYFSHTQETVWLGTAPGTRAETFYRKQGWKENGKHGKEIKFEMTAEAWQGQSKSKRR